MQLLFPFFYRQYGIRRLQQLIEPVLHDISDFHFPRNSIFHFTSFDGNVDSFDPNSNWFKGYNKRILVDYVGDLTGDMGHPHKKNIQLMTFYRPFMVKHKQFKFMKDAPFVTHDGYSLIVQSYGYLHHLYRYTVMPLTPYYAWHNLQKTVLDKINDIAGRCDREHFIMMNVPKSIPSLQQLKMFQDKINRQLIERFNSPEKLLFLELWKWLGNNPETSIFNNIKSQNYSKINIILIANNQFCVLNLANLHAWRKTNENETDDNEIKSNIKLKPEVFQKFLIKFFIQLNGKVPEEAIPNELESTSTETDNPEERLKEDNEDNDEEYETGSSNNNDTNELSQLKLNVSEKTDINPNKKETEIKSQEDNEDEINSDDIIKLNTKEDIDKILKIIDLDLETLENIEKDKVKTLLGVGVNTKSEIEGFEAPKVTVHKDEVHKALFEDTDIVSSLTNSLDIMAANELVTASEYRNQIKLIEQSAKLPNPYTPNKNLGQSIVIDKKDLIINKETTELPVANKPFDESMANSSLNVFDRKYINEVLSKDVVAGILNVQKAGVVIQDYKIENVSSVLGEYEHHSLKIKPLDGSSSTIHFKIPKVQEDGTFKAGGNVYYLRKQFFPLPIVKAGPSTVSLTSYYGKTFVERGRYAISDTSRWITKTLLKDGLSGENPNIIKINPANVYDNYFEAPRLYSQLAMHFKSLHLKDCNITFDHKERTKLFPIDKLPEIELEGAVFVGYSKKKQPIVMAKNNYFYTMENGKADYFGSIYSLTGLEQAKAPVDYASVRVFSKYIPVGVVLSMMFGFHNMLNYFGFKYREVEANKRKNLLDHEWSIDFMDVSYIFSKNDEKVCLFFAGFNEYYRVVKKFEVRDFDKKDVYLNLFESKGMSAIYIKELEILDTLFVDPITKNILEEMKLPVTFKGLLIESVNMLLTGSHPDFQDMNHMRIRGYERLSGVIYKELAQAIRQYRTRNIRSREQIELNPYAVWMKIAKDPAVSLSQQINPIENIKQTEAVTFVGEGGRDKDTLNKASRAYHKTSRGIVSEATVDSSDVGINAFLTGDPKFSSVRGIPVIDNKLSATNIFSASALSAPCCDVDDAKRVNFVSIQQAHTIISQGYHQAYLQTGYEKIIPNRVSKQFAYVAEKDGKIISKTDKGIIVEYADKTKVGNYLGRIFGKAEGSVYPQDIVSPFEVGDKVKKGEIISYNSGFFEPDFFNPRTVVWKTSLNAKVALCETNQTLEDSSAISTKLSRKLTTNKTKIRSFIVDFKQEIRKPVKAGDEIKPNDILFIIEEATTANVDLFDEETIELLSKFSNKAPKAKIYGTVDKIEVFYHGDKSDMSTSLKALANASDKILAEEERSTGKNVVTGEVDSDYRVSGTPLSLDQAEIKVYLTAKVVAGVGDKGVFANQMKSVVGQVMKDEVFTQNGEEVDAIFGYKSIANRIVTSPIVIGTTTTILKEIAKQAVQAYKGK